ncbi:MAG: uracil-DNA glycosylase [Eubacteriales bacterium]|jgi:uracil-DNA glycosylase family 4
MKTWEELKEACLTCNKCKLSETRTNVVFGEGNPEAEVLFIGEGPGEREDVTGLPFVGRAGKLLDDMLCMIGLDRSKIFIANIVKCRPPNNRDPLHEEQKICIEWLRAQTTLIKPKIIVCLGRIAAQVIIRPDFKITAEHGKWFVKANTHIMATLHPAALLRDPRRRPDSFDDFETLRLKIEEICERTELS